MLVYTSTGNALELVEPAIKQGGEGAVYRIKNYPHRVAKIYSDPVDAKKREAKLSAQVSVFDKVNQTTEGIIAWPMGLLYNGSRSFIGFGMSCVTASKELDDLYAYPPKKEFDLNLKDKIICLVHLCEDVKRIHDLGQCIGDLNPNNMKIDENSLNVYLVDCDSYNFNQGAKTFKCLVCAPGYVAPEVIKACKGYTYENCPKITFTKNTDNFSLGIHIFRMLFNGTHPYARRRAASNEIEKSNLGSISSLPVPNCDRSVEKGESLYFQKISGYDIPIWSPDITSIPDYLRKLFERAFVEGNTNPDARPKPEEWIEALKRYSGELTYCGEHYYWKGNKGRCPYCEANKRFIARIPTKKTQQPVVTPVVPAATGNFVHHTVGNNNSANSSSYMTNNGRTADERTGQTKAIIGMILGIVAICDPIYGLGFFIGIVSLILNILARNSKYHGKVLSYGLLTSILGILIGLIVGAFYFFLWSVSNYDLN